MCNSFTWIFNVRNSFKSSFQNEFIYIFLCTLDRMNIVVDESRSAIKVGQWFYTGSLVSTRFGVDERWMEKGEGSESRSLVSRSEPRGMNNPWTSWEEANISFTLFIGHFAWNAQMFIHTLHTRVNELSAYKIIHEAIKQFCTFSFYLISQWNPFACVIIAPSGGKLRIKNYPIFIFIFLCFLRFRNFGEEKFSLFFSPHWKNKSLLRNIET